MHGGQRGVAAIRGSMINQVNHCVWKPTSPSHVLSFSFLDPLELLPAITGGRCARQLAPPAPLNQLQHGRVQPGAAKAPSSKCTSGERPTPTTKMTGPRQAHKLTAASTYEVPSCAMTGTGQQQPHCAASNSAMQHAAA